MCVFCLEVDEYLRVCFTSTIELLRRYNFVHSTMYRHRPFFLILERQYFDTMDEANYETVFCNIFS